MTKLPAPAALVNVDDVVQVPFLPENEYYRVIAKATFPDDTVELFFEATEPNTVNPLTSRRCHRTVNYLIVTD